MKKILALVLALVMVLALCACGSETTEAAEEIETTEAVEEVAEEADAAEEAEEAEEVEEAEESDKTAEGRTFIMGIDPEYPPFSYLGDDGEYTGFDVEICQAACEKLGWTWDVFGVNWDEKLIQLDAGECDCVWAGMTILESMKEAGYVISEPYYYNTQVLVVKEGSGIESSADLEGKYVAVMLGTSGETLLNEDMVDLRDTFAELITCDSFLKCFTELEGGAVDAVFVDLPVAASYVKDKEGLVVLNEDLGAEQYGIAFRADDQEVCDAIQAAVDELVEEGTYAEIASDEAYAEIVDNLLFLQ